MYPPVRTLFKFIITDSKYFGLINMQKEKGTTH